MPATPVTLEVRYRLDNSNAPWTVKTFPADSTSIRLTEGVVRGQAYDVEARYIGDNGVPSAWVPQAVTVANPSTVPLAPTGLTALGVADGVALKWTAPDLQPSDVEYVVERSANGSTGWAAVHRTRATGWTDPLVDETVWWYRVKAESFAGVSSAYSNIVSENGVALASVQAAVDAADAAASAAQAAADAANLALADIASDSLLTPDEKPQVIRDNNVILTEQPGIDAQAAAYGITSERTAYNNAVSGLTSYLATLTSPYLWSNLVGNTTIVGATFRQKFADVYTTRQALLNRIHAAAKALADLANSTANTSALVKDGGFEAGGQGWMLAPNALIDRSAGVPYIGSAALTHDPVAGGPIRQSGCEMFAVAPGERIVAEAMLRNVSGANGDAALVILFYDEAGNFIASGASQSYANGRNAGSDWRKCTVLALVPANARKCRIGMETTNSAGFWVGDQFRASKQPQVEPQPSNLIPNANFGGINGDKAPWVIGWNPNNANIDRFRSKKEGMIGPDWTVEGATGQLEVRQVGRTGGSPGVVDFHCGTTSASLISVIPGQRYELHCKIAAHRCDATIGVMWYDANKAYIGESTAPYARANGGKAESLFAQTGGFFTAPGNAAFARVILRKTDTDAGQSDSWAWFIKPYFGPAKADQQEFSPWVPSQTWTADEVPTGSFGVVSATDLWDAGGTRRLGLRVHGSGHRLGSQSNVPQSLTTAYGSVRNATALTASSDGTVSVNAHVVRYGGFSVSYNAVANAVTGLAQNTRYVIYCFDPDYTGGTKTWYAGTNPDAVMQLGDGVVIAGEITIPTSGTSSGGGGSGGGGGGGGEWCVDADMVLPGGTRAGDVRAGQRIAVWNDDPARPAVEWLEVESNTLAPDQPCHRLTSASGAGVIASDCTPMTLRDGRIVRMDAMAGEDVLVLRDGCLAWEPVAELVPVAPRAVAKIKVHQRCYFAGESAAATIATHNPIMKP